MTSLEFWSWMAVVVMIGSGCILISKWHAERQYAAVVKAWKEHVSSEREAKPDAVEGGEIPMVGEL